MPQLIRRIGNIWATRLRYESRLGLDERIYTKKLVEFSQKRPQLMETQSLEYMTSKTADVVLAYLRLEIHENIFPFFVEKPDEAKVISQTLKRHTYPCSQALFTLLRKSSNVLSIEEAQKEAFVNAVTASEEVQELQLCRMVRDFVSRVDRDLQVLVKSNALLDTYVSGSTFFVSEALITSKASKAEVINVLNQIEFELVQHVSEKDFKRIALACKNFIASSAFWTYIEDGHSPMASGLDSMTQVENQDTPLPPLIHDDSNNSNHHSSPPSKKLRLADPEQPSVEVINHDDDNFKLSNEVIKVEDCSTLKQENHLLNQARSDKAPVGDDIVMKRKQRKYERTNFRLGNSYCVELVTPIAEKQKSVSFSLRAGESCKNIPVTQTTEVEIPEGCEMHQKDGRDLSFSVSVKKTSVKEEPVQ
ncbi:hypothetical protein FGB62_107g013 [Gracilaria domingensis]|nr:hypothetical protein FGB62_107g013 [Gracilaria domingensis]